MNIVFRKIVAVLALAAVCLVGSGAVRALHVHAEPRTVHAALATVQAASSCPAHVCEHVAANDIDSDSNSKSDSDTDPGEKHRDPHSSNCVICHLLLELAKAISLDSPSIPIGLARCERACSAAAQVPNSPFFATYASRAPPRNS